MVCRGVLGSRPRDVGDSTVLVVFIGTCGYVQEIPGVVFRGHETCAVRVGETVTV